MPVAVDPDIMEQVQQQDPAAPFKSKVGDPKKLHPKYGPNDEYYLLYKSRINIQQDSRTLIEE